MYTLVVVGAGGTGSYFLKEFARYIHHTQKQKEFKKMVIFDGDSVEQKNLMRQSFIKEDIGRNKAVVMAEALNDNFDLKFESYACYLNNKNQLEDVVEGIPLIISCVDNHGCRLLLEDFFHSYNHCIYFDSANEFENGEVVYSYKKDGKVYGPVRSFYFPNILKDDVRTREEMSCEELNNVEPQHIFTNMLAGNLLCTGVSNLLEKKVTPGFAYFNSHTYSSSFIAYCG